MAYSPYNWVSGEPITRDKLNRIEQALGGAASAADITSAINALKGGAPAAYDTLVEIASKLDADDSALAALVSSVAGKYAKPSGGIPLTDLKKADLDAAYATVWQAGEVLTAGARRTLPIARVGTLKANGTTGSTFDATEQSKWSYPRMTFSGVGAPTADIPGATTGDRYVDTSTGTEYDIAS